MSIATQERTSYAGTAESPKSADPPKAYQIIDDLLARVDEISDEEVESEFHILAALATGAQRLGLPKYAEQGQIEEYRATVPGADDLIEKIHQTAEEVLEQSPNLTDHEAVLTVNYLGIAADLTNDARILDKTINALKDTQDYTLVNLKRALEFARHRNMLFYTAYRDIKNGNHALTAVTTSERILSDDPSVSVFYRKETPRKIDMDNLFHESKTFTVPEINPDFQFLSGEQAKKIGRETLRQ